MPNWCECDLTIEGPKTKVEEFLAFAKSEEEGAFDFNRFLPYPEQYAALDKLAAEWEKTRQENPGISWDTRPKDGFNSGGYDWCVANWGTKWNACNATVGELSEWAEEEKAAVEINFETAWSPPTPIIEKAAEMFPDLVFDLRYFEAGGGFNGVYRCENGEETMDKSGDYFGSRGG